jgi:transposase-like protein
VSAETQGVQLLDPDGLLSQVTKVLERALGEEMTEHLGYEARSGRARLGQLPRRNRSQDAAWSQWQVPRGPLTGVVTTLVDMAPALAMTGVALHLATCA